MGKNILIIAAHSDDEALGCGGTIARHASEGDKVGAIFLTDGVSSRSYKYRDRDNAKLRNEYSEEAAKILGISWVKNLGFPDNKLDSIPMLDIVQKIEHHVLDFVPDIVYTHYPLDLNIDHRVASNAALTAFRPLPGSSCSKVLFFEVRSSTEWSISVPNNSFSPNYFVDISNFLESKVSALKCYDSEMRAFPHTRSYESIEMQAKLHGSSVGLYAAEAFMIARVII